MLGLMTVEVLLRLVRMSGYGVLRWLFPFTPDR